jgi:type VI secretion system protein ImpF
VRAHTNPARLTLSILDRLTDLDPESTAEPRPHAWEEMRDLKASLCRDLAALLNTRREEQPFDPAYEEAANSVLTYGVTDFTSYTLTNSIEQELVRRSIERAIRQFEPRIIHVNVSLEEPSAVKPVLRFHIEAMLRIDARESVAFDVTLHRDSRRMSVSGADR